MRVWVVMSNDFPDCVFASEELAEQYCQKKMKEPKNKFDYPTSARRIYYRHYEFEVHGELT